MELDIIKPNGEHRKVLILKHKDTEEYSFVNLTRGHICPCKFLSIEAALKDLNDYVKDGRVKSYRIVER